MYFHQSPTVKTIKALKVARANEMKQLTNAMKLVTEKYAPLLKDLESLRANELKIESMLSRLSSDQLAVINKKISRKQTFLQSKLNKTIDKL